MGDTVGKLTYRGYSSIAYKLPCPQLDRLITIRLNYDHSSLQYIMDVRFDDMEARISTAKTWRVNIVPETIESKHAPTLRKGIVLQAFEAALLDMQRQFGVPPPDTEDTEALWPD